MAEPVKTRSAKNFEDDEKLIQRVIEKIFGSEKFLSKLMSKISQTVTESIEAVTKVYNEKVEQLSSDLSNIRKTIDDQEQFSRNNNLRIYGLPEEKDENLNQKIVTLFREKLDVSICDDDIDYCYRLKNKEGGIKPIVARLCRNHIKQKIFKSKSKLKGSKLVIKEDLTKQRLAVYKKACEKCGPKNVWSYEGKIMCKANNRLYKLTALVDLDNVNKVQVSEPTSAL